MTEIKKTPTPEDKSKDAKSTAEAAELNDEALEQVAGGNTNKPHYDVFVEDSQKLN